MKSPLEPSNTARTLVLALALLGVATTGLAGLFSMGSAAASIQRVEHARRLPRDVPHSAHLEAQWSKWRAVALLGAAVLGLLGVATVRWPKRSALLLFLAFALPVPFALWTFCPATPYLVASLLALRIRPPPSADA